MTPAFHKGSVCWGYPDGSLWAGLHGKVHSRILGHGNGKSRTGDKIKRSPGAEWLTDIRGKGKVRNDGVVAFLGGGLMGGRLWKIQMWGDSDGV